MPTNPATAGSTASKAPTQRRAQIAELLARGLLRLHRRAALATPPNSPAPGAGPEIPLDSCARTPLSVSEDRHNGSPRRSA